MTIALSAAMVLAIGQGLKLVIDEGFARGEARLLDEPHAGRVTIDGIDARAADPRELRRRIAVVAHDPVIFAASVLDNVRYGRPEATDAEVRRALEAAYAMDFVERLMQGRTTLVIAHRLATVKSSTRIVVMDHGRIVASGTHAALAALQFATT